MGMVVPIAPTAVAIMAVLIVRILVWTRTKSIKWNIAVCALAILGAMTSIEGTDYSVFRGFWLGVGYGALGVGIIEIGKSAIFKALSTRFADAANVLFGLGSKKD